MMMSSDKLSTIQSELNLAREVLDRCLNDAEFLSKVDLAHDFLVEAISNDHKIICCGNGGSHCDAMHFAEEMTGRFRSDRRPLPALVISDPAHISCVSNDYGFDQIFSRYIEGIGRSGDVLFALSTSGNSPNILNALRAARSMGIKSIVLTGNDGGKAASMADVEIRVPYSGFSDRIQEIHIKIIHILIHLVERTVI